MRSQDGLLRQRGVIYLCTSTPRVKGRTFGTNMVEAVLTALRGAAGPLTAETLAESLSEFRLTPVLMRLDGAD